MHHTRVSRRYQLREMVAFWCNGHEMGTPSGLGVTENVSRTGISFLTDGVAEVGSTISLNLHLRSPMDAEKTILLHAEGTVLRVEAAGTQNKVAAAIQFQEDLEGDFSISRSVQ
jgi:hypothetical protein